MDCRKGGDMKKNPELTKKKIRDAFLELYKTTRIESISIGEVTQKAGVYRGTFYYYYKDIYDLLDQIEKSVLENVKRVIPQLIEAVLNGKMNEKAYLVDELFGDQEGLLRLFFVEKPNYRLLQCLKEYAKAAALKILRLQAAELPGEIAYFMEYIASAQIGLLTMWLKNDRDISTGEMAAIMMAANLKGPMTCVMSFARGSV